MTYNPRAAASETNPVPVIPGTGATFGLAAGTNVIGKVGVQVGGSDVSMANPIPVTRSPLLSVTQDSGANMTQTITVAAEASKKHYAWGFEVAISAADAAADITVVLNDGATAKWKSIIGSGQARGTRVGIMFPGPIEMTTNTAMTLVVGAGGAAVVTSANLLYKTI